MREPTQIRLPQLGEGIREARVVALLATPGAIVTQDQPVLEVETDKAVYTIEAPADGTLGLWKCAVGSVVEVGAVIVEILPESSGAQEVSRNVYASPRTRAYADNKGISNEEFARIASNLGQSTVGVADVDKWLGLHKSPPTPNLFRHIAPAGTITARCNWDAVQRFRRSCRQAGSIVPAGAEVVAWSTAQAMLKHSRFRGIVKENGDTETQDAVVLGVAVALPNDALGTALVSHSEGQTLAEFVLSVRESVNACRKGDRPRLPPQVVLSSMSHLGIETAVPVVVPPSVATLFLGSPCPTPVPVGETGLQWHRTAQLSLGFDHRAVNGAAAARFLRDIAKLHSVLPETASHR